MNFDINQDLSSLQNVRKSRGKGMRPGKPKAKPSPAVVAKPVPQQTAGGRSVSAALDTNTVLEHANTPATEAAIGPQISDRQPAMHQTTGPEASGVHAAALPPTKQAVATELRHSIASVGPSGPAERPLVSRWPELAEPERRPAPEGPGQHEASDVGDLPQPPQRASPARKRSCPELGTNISKKAAKPRKKKKKANSDLAQLVPADHDPVTAVACDETAVDEEQVGAVAASAVNQYDEMTRALCPGKRQKGTRKKIDPTAPIDPKSMTLMDVIRHAHSNANILDRQYKQLKANEAKDKDQAAAAGEEDSPAPPEASGAGPSLEHNPLAPQLVLRDGKIVVDQGSLTVQANVPVGRRTVEVEEDDDTLINSHSYLPVSKLTKERWTQQETELFYQILRSYGADFTFMSQCFQGRTRKQVKNKYLKEERVNPARVKAAMSGSQTATLEQLTTLAQPGTAAADFAGMLPAGGNGAGGSIQERPEQERAEDDDDGCLGTAVDPTLADFFY